MVFGSNRKRLCLVLVLAQLALPFEQSAHAGFGDVFIGLLASGGAPAGGSTMNTRLGIDLGVGPLTEQIQTLNGNLTTTNGQWSTTNDLLSAATGNWTQSNQLWNASNQQFAQFNQNWSQTNGIIQSVVDPLHMFAVGAAMGVGFAVGGIVMSVAIQALKGVVGAAHEAITHQKRDKRIFEAFQAAMESYKELSAAAEEVEARVASFTFVARQIREARGGKNEVLSTFNNTLFHLKVQSKMLGENLERLYELNEAPLDEEYASQRARKISAMAAANKTNERSIKKFRKTLENTSEDRICARLKAEMDLLIQAENALQDARMVLLDPLGEKVWEDLWNRKVKETSDLAKRYSSKWYQRQLHKTRTKSVDKNYLTYLKSDPETKKQVYANWRSCMWSRSRLAGIPVLGHIFFRQIRNSCWEQAKNPDSYATPYREIMTPYSESLETLSEGSGLGGGGVHDFVAGSDGFEDVELVELGEEVEDEFPRINPNTNAKALMSFRRMFARMQKEQTVGETQKRSHALTAWSENVDRVCGF